MEEACPYTPRGMFLVTCFPSNHEIHGKRNYHGETGKLLLKTKEARRGYILTGKVLHDFIFFLKKNHRVP